MRFWRKGEPRVGSAGVLARNSVSCKRLTRIHARFFIFDRINMINMIWSAGVLARNSVSCKRLTRIHARFFIFDRINMINMIWRASVPTSRLPLCGRMVSQISSVRSTGRGKRLLARGRADARPFFRQRSRRQPVKISASLRLCVKKTLNAQLSTFNAQFSAGGDARAPDCARRTNHALGSRTPCHQPFCARRRLP
jgi:hypothetical protein